MKYLILILTVLLVGCGNESVSRQEQQATEKAMLEANSQVGMPSIVNFQEKRWAKMIFELRDRPDLITYAYIVSLEGKLVFIGKCIGYGLPYSVQYTSPESMQKNINFGEYYRLPQADPNGLYMPDGLSATWLLMFDKDTQEVKPVYIEPEIIVSPIKLH